MSFDEARTLFARGDAAGTLRLLRPLLDQRPERPELLHLAALAERTSGNMSGARDLLARAIALGPASAEMHNTLGNILSGLGDADGAVRQFDAAVARDPAYAHARINRGRLASRRGRHDEAITDLAEACRLAPGLGLAHAAHGNALRAAGRPGEALGILRRAVSADPRRLDRRLFAALALREAGRPQEGVAELDAAEQSGLKGSQLLEVRAGCRMETGDAAGARIDLERLVAEDPFHWTAHQALSRLVIEYELPGDPYANYRALAARHPGERTIWESWLASVMSFRDYRLAADLADRAIASLGGHPLLLLARAISLSELGELGRAQADFEAAGPAVGKNGDYFNALARHSLRNGDVAGAAAAAEQVLDFAPDDQLAWAYLGTAWRLAGDEREHWLNQYDAHAIQAEAVPPGWEGDSRSFAEAAAPTLRGLHHAISHPPDQTLRNGTQTFGALFSRPEPEIAAIRDAVLAAYDRFAAGLATDKAHPLLRRRTQAATFAGSWSVRLHGSGHHVSHIHPQGWISSAYHFVTPEPDVDDPDAGSLQLGAPPAELGLELAPRRIIRPRPGHLVLFPSFMWHGTIPFHQGDERLTCAFDLIPVG